METYVREGTGITKWFRSGIVICMDMSKDEVWKTCTQRIKKKGNHFVWVPLGFKRFQQLHRFLSSEICSRIVDFSRGGSQSRRRSKWEFGFMTHEFVFFWNVKELTMTLKNTSAIIFTATRKSTWVDKSRKLTQILRFIVLWNFVRDEQIFRSWLCRDVSIVNLLASSFPVSPRRIDKVNYSWNSVHSHDEVGWNLSIILNSVAP